MSAHRVVKLILPDGSRRRIVAGRVKQILLGTSQHRYKKWIKKYETETLNRTKKIDNNQLLISIVVPCYNTPKRYFDELLKSVMDQIYENWQLCIVDGSSSDQESAYISRKCKSDHRISYKKIGENLGIVGNTNIGLNMAEGDFIAFMDHDDTLSPYALSEVALAINANPKADIIYSDEDKLSDNGKIRQLPFFKPDWSPELLLGINYITHLVVARKTLVDRLGGLRKGFDGAQDYDFLLRATEKTTNILHIPKVLYHWRLAEGSTAKQVSEKKYANTAGKKALKDAVIRRGLDAEVMDIANRPTNYRIKFQIPKSQPKVSIIIPFKDKVGLLKQCVNSIFVKTTYKNYELILISNNSSESATDLYLRTLKKDERCKIYEWNQPFNYSAINNFGRTKARGEYLIFLNNDTKVITPAWIEELVGVASQTDIGAAGPLLYYPNKTIQHAGVILGMGGMAGHAFRRRSLTDWTEFGTPAWPRNYLAVTGACLMVSANKFDKVKGFDETLKIGGNDVALCLRLYEKGWRNVFWPFAALVHYENMSVGPYHKSVPPEDYNRSLEYYNKYLKQGDPYFNVNLDDMNEQISVRT